MKTKITFIALSLILISFNVMAYVTVDFPGWDALTARSSDILIVHCINVQDPFNSKMNGHPIDFRGLIEADFEIVSVLKGTKNSGVVRMRSEYWPKQGIDYLVFKYYVDGVYGGLEDYRVVPLGSPFTMNPITGKPLDKQLQSLFKLSAGYLDTEMQRDQEKKSLIEKAIWK